MRPFVIINCAVSADGKTALPSKMQTRISDEEDMKRVHELRSGCDVILVGIGTILADDPRLTVKEEYVPGGRNPIRIVVDSKGKLPSSAKVLNGESKTIVVTAEECTASFSGAEMMRCGRGKVDLSLLLELLYRRGMKTILVEGGGTLIWSFLKEGLADELKVFVASFIIGGASSPTLADGLGARSLQEVIPLKLVNHSRLGSGILLEYKVER